MFDTVEALLTIQITKEAGVIHRLRTYYRKSLIMDRWVCCLQCAADKLLSTVRC